MIEVLRPPAELGQYTSLRYTERLAEIGAVPSVGTVGDSYDNTLAETVNGLYKAEMVWPHPAWRNSDDLELATLEYVEWWNHRRLHSAIGMVTPAEAEQAYYRIHDTNPQQPIPART